VHPLLLAIGSERYVPYAERRRPQELLTQANAILGQGQMSLAKYLLLVAHEDNPALEIQKIDDFLAHLLARVDWERDLHFQTCTTIDTLDYSGSGFNEGSKVVIAAVGPARRELPTALTGAVAGMSLPAGFGQPQVALPGVLAVQGPAWQGEATAGKDRAVERFAAELTRDHPLCRFPLVVIVDDSEFAARSLGNLLWVTFTRSNPAADIYGVESFTHEKHWGCHGALVIDARLKPHLAPPLVEDPAVVARVERLAQKGGPLAGIL
jgi:4-hydroxy-3-polyprenylbenzoate decarboxylase